MKDKILKNISLEEALELKELVSCHDGQIVSRTLVQNTAVSITLFAFDAGEEISTHESKGDALVTILDGSGVTTISGKEHALGIWQSIVMPAGIPYAVKAASPFKMLMVVVFPAR